ncbi:MAG: DUF421 domain-containing protein [Halanaerobiales bacterium]|nr:DUF421 domain-containing protein [Halanaerobiales bacterium]
MLQTSLQILIIFILTISLMRLMGKSSIVQLTPYDLVAIIMVGTIVAEPLITTEFAPSIVRALLIVVFYLIFAKLSLNQVINKFLLGKPSILIKHGKIVEDILEKEHVSLIQLLSILRTAGYSKLTEIDYAILEPTGSISVIPIPSARPVTLADLDIEGEYEGLPLSVMIDGIIQKKNLKLINKDETWLKDKLKEKGITDLKQVIYAFVDDKSESIYYDLRNEKVDSTQNSDMQKTKKDIYLIKGCKIQSAGLKEAKITKTELLNWLGTNSIDGIDEMVLHQRLQVKRKR